MVEIVQNMDSKRRYAFFASLAIIVIIVAGFAIWVFTPKYKPLFNKLDESTAAVAISKLEEQSIPYEVAANAEGNAISVPESMADRLRVTLGGELGVPEVQGLELFDNADYSMTDFTQDVTYKRAIQGELARTIASMPGVKTARVHVTFAPKRLFSADQQDAKASVYVEQLDELKLAPAQISGIKKLVSNSIEKLTPLNVAVFDTQGMELGATDNGLESQIDTKHEAKLSIEQDLMEKAYRLLTLSISPEKIAVAIDVTLNFDQRKMTKQGYATGGSADGLIVRQKESSVNKTSTAPTEQVSPIVSTEKETEFTHGREMEETVFSSGEIELLSVAVAIREPLNDQQIASVKSLLTAGMGLSKERGDTIAVEVLNVQTIQTRLPQSEMPLMESPLRNEDSAESNTSEPTTSDLDSMQQYAFNANLIWAIALVTLLFSGVVFLNRNRKRLSPDKRQALLLEVQEWLEREDPNYVKS